MRRSEHLGVAIANAIDCYIIDLAFALLHLLLGCPHYAGIYMCGFILQQLLLSIAVLGVPYFLILVTGIRRELVTAGCTQCQQKGADLVLTTPSTSTSSNVSSRLPGRAGGGRQQQQQ